MDNLSLGYPLYMLFFSYTWTADIVIPVKDKNICHNIQSSSPVMGENNIIWWKPELLIKGKWLNKRPPTLTEKKDKTNLF